jgi:hypothetical protein
VIQTTYAGEPAEVTFSVELQYGTYASLVQHQCRDRRQRSQGANTVHPVIASRLDICLVPA